MTRVELKGNNWGRTCIWFQDEPRLRQIANERIRRNPPLRRTKAHRVWAASVSATADDAEVELPTNRFHCRARGTLRSVGGSCADPVTHSKERGCSAAPCPNGSRLAVSDSPQVGCCWRRLI